MAAVIQIKIEISGGLDAAKKDVADLGKTAQEKGGGGFSALQEIATGALRKIGEMVVNVGAAAFQKFGEVIGNSISAARESNQVAAQTAQVITSTGSAAGVTAQHVLDYASALSAASGKSLFGDEQIAQSTNLLLTFTNIKGATLDAATAISVDMAQALGGAPKDAAIQLGKALNDPIKGITALTRVGVTFSDEQKAQIQAMQEAGDTAGAQAVILAELNKEFGGSAAAAAQADGGFAQFQDRLGEMEETIGKAILPVLGQLMGVLNDTLLPIVENATTQIGPFIDTLMQSYDEGGIVGLLNTIAFAITGIVGAFNPLMDTIDTFIAAWPQMMAQVQPVVDFITANLTPILSGLAAMIAAVVIPAFVSWAIAAGAAALATIVAMAPIVLAVAAIGVAVGLLVAAWQNDWGGIQEKVAAVWTVVQPIFDAIVLWLQTNIPIAIQATVNFVTTVLIPAFQSIWDFIQANILPLFQILWTWLSVTLPNGVQVLANYWNQTLLPALNAVWGFLNTYVIPLFTALVNLHLAVLGLAVRTLTAIWNTELLPAITAIYTYVKNFLGPIFDWLTVVIFTPFFKIVNDISISIIGTLLPMFTKLSSLVKDEVAAAFNNLNSFASGAAGALHSIGNAIHDVIGYINDLVAKLNSVSVPDWLQGHSPPPMADWFSDIAGAAGAVNAQLPTLAMNLAAQLGPSGQTVSNTASTRSFTYAPTVYQSGGGDMPMDLALASSLASV